MGRYAEGTKVSVESSRGDISGILTRYGVQRMGWQTGPDGDELLFELKGNNYRFRIARPTLDEVKKAYVDAGGRWNLVYDHQAKVDAEWRRRWRANVLLIKAKLEFADGGDTTLEREFMPYLLVDGRRTLGDMVEAGDLKQLTA